MAVTHLLKLTLHWTGFGEEGTLAWHFAGNAASHTPVELSNAAGNVINKWETVRTPSTKTQFTPMLNAGQHADLVSLYEYDVSPGPATAIGTRAPTGWTGVGATSGGPLQTSLVASLRTDLAGASYRGRQYFPGHTLLVGITTMLISNTATDALAALAANMGLEAALGIGESLSIDVLDWVVYSPTKAVTTPIRNVVVDNKLDTQRRREAQLQPTRVTTQVVTA